MAGTLPRTAYLLVKGGVVQGNFNSKIEIFLHIGGSVSDRGVVSIKRVEQNPSYVMKGSPNASHVGAGFESKMAAAIDWANSYMGRALPPDYAIYRYLLSY